jgi:RNA polymerase sigma-70 factor (ECF subfamily)
MTLIGHFEDRALARKVIRGDRRATAAFFETYFARLYRFAVSRVTDESAVEDIVQETLIRALANLDGYRGEAALFTWLCQICRSQISDFWRRQGHRAAQMVPIDDLDGVRHALDSLGNDAFTDETERVSLDRLIQLTLDHIPERYGRVLELKYIEGLSVAEIAGRLDTGPTASQSVLARARVAFRKVFEELAGEALVRPGPGS